MDAIQSEFRERVGRAVSRFFHHAAGEGLDPAALNGTVTLQLEDGKLVDVDFEPAAPVELRGSSPEAKPKRKSSAASAGKPSTDDEPAT